jgi:RNA polymerase sigma factor (TIGR02999 family)
MLDDLFSAAYEELRRLAAAVRAREASVTLSPTALVNEAYLRLAASLPPKPNSHLHFKRVATRAMRQVLVDAARQRRALKRGGEVALVTLDDGCGGQVAPLERVLAVDGALNELARVDRRQAEMIELRFFGGYDLAETAKLLGVSEATVVRDWRAAKAWLAHQLE